MGWGFQGVQSPFSWRKIYRQLVIPSLAFSYLLTLCSSSLTFFFLTLLCCYCCFSETSFLCVAQAIVISALPLVSSSLMITLPLVQVAQAILRITLPLVSGSPGYPHDHPSFSARLLQLIFFLRQGSYSPTGCLYASSPCLHFPRDGITGMC